MRRFTDSNIRKGILAEVCCSYTWGRVRLFHMFSLAHLQEWPMESTGKSVVVTEHAITDYAKSSKGYRTFSLYK